MKVCLFDIDGTLIRSGGAGKRAFETALQHEFGVDVADHEVPFSGRTDRAIVGDLFALHNIENTKDTWHRFQAAYLSHLPVSLEAHDGSVLPGVQSLLHEFDRRDDVAVGLLTGNLAEGARIKLGYFGIAGFFRFGGYGDRHLDRNAVAHEAVAAARERLATRFLPGHVWVIGDTPLDIRCARAIGAKVIAVCTGMYAADELETESPDLLMDDLSENERIVEVLFA